MKYYPNLPGGKSNFITNYEIKDDLIIIYYADKRICSCPYSKAIEKETLNKMKNQFLSANENKGEYRYNISLDLLWNFISLYWTIYNGFYFFAEDKNKVLRLILSSLEALCFVFFNSKLIKDFNMYADIRKHELFLENEDILNQEYNSFINNMKNDSKIEPIVPDNIVNYNINSVNEIGYFKLKKMIKKAKKIK